MNCRRWFFAFACAVASCRGPTPAEPSADHSHGESAEDAPVVRVTLFSDQFELFAEHPPARVGEALEVIAHVTVLAGFAPRDADAATLVLAGPAPLTATAAQPARPGIYKLQFTPQIAGNYRGHLALAGPAGGVVAGFALQVADAKAEPTPAAAADPNAIVFLKEQQWSLPFATAIAAETTLTATLAVSGHVDMPPEARSAVGAPVAGRLLAPASGFPLPGQLVQAGQVVALLQPAPASPEGAARAGLAVAEAEARAVAAGRAVDRAQRLVADGAVPARDLEDARREAGVAGEAVKAARRAGKLFASTAGLAAEGALPLVAPRAGVVLEVTAVAGAAVAPGTPLVQLVDADAAWLVAQVPEWDLARLNMHLPVLVREPGRGGWRAMGTGVARTGQTTDAEARTVAVAYAAELATQHWPLGMRLEMQVPVGAAFTGLAVPRAAIVDRDGQEVVYIQIDGEHFAERRVTTGIRVGDLVAVVQGLHSGERFVVRGALLVRLADRPKGETPHGHVH